MEKEDESIFNILEIDTKCFDIDDDIFTIVQIYSDDENHQNEDMDISPNSSFDAEVPQSGIIGVNKENLLSALEDTVNNNDAVFVDQNSLSNNFNVQEELRNHMEQDELNDQDSLLTELEQHLEQDSTLFSEETRFDVDNLDLTPNENEIYEMENVEPLGNSDSNSTLILGSRDVDDTTLEIRSHENLDSALCLELLAGKSKDLLGDLTVIQAVTFKNLKSSENSQLKTTSEALDSVNENFSKADESLDSDDTLENIVVNPEVYSDSNETLDPESILNLDTTVVVDVHLKEYTKPHENVEADSTLEQCPDGVVTSEESSKVDNTDRIDDLQSISKPNSNTILCESSKFDEVLEMAAKNLPFNSEESSGSQDNLEHKSTQHLDSALDELDKNLEVSSKNSGSTLNAKTSLKYFSSGESFELNENLEIVNMAQKNSNLKVTSMIIDDEGDVNTDSKAVTGENLTMDCSNKLLAPSDRSSDLVENIEVDQENTMVIEQVVTLGKEISLESDSTKVHNSSLDAPIQENLEISSKKSDEVESLRCHASDLSSEINENLEKSNAEPEIEESMNIDQDENYSCLKSGTEANLQSNSKNELGGSDESFELNENLDIVTKEHKSLDLDSMLKSPSKSVDQGNDSKESMDIDQDDSISDSKSGTELDGNLNIATKEHKSLAFDSKLETPSKSVDLKSDHISESPSYESFELDENLDIVAKERKKDSFLENPSKSSDQENNSTEAMNIDLDDNISHLKSGTELDENPDIVTKDHRNLDSDSILESPSKTLDQENNLQSVEISESPSYESFELDENLDIVTKKQKSLDFDSMLPTPSKSVEQVSQETMNIDQDDISDLKSGIESDANLDIVTKEHKNLNLGGSILESHCKTKEHKKDSMLHTSSKSVDHENYFKSDEISESPFYKSFELNENLDHVTKKHERDSELQTPPKSVDQRNNSKSDEISESPSNGNLDTTLMDPNSAPESSHKILHSESTQNFCLNSNESFELDENLEIVNTGFKNLPDPTKILETASKVNTSNDESLNIEPESKSSLDFKEVVENEKELKSDKNLESESTSDIPPKLEDEGTSQIDLKSETAIEPENNEIKDGENTLPNKIEKVEQFETLNPANFGEYEEIEIIEISLDDSEDEAEYTEIKEEVPDIKPLVNGDDVEDDSEEVVCIEIPIDMDSENEDAGEEVICEIPIEIGDSDEEDLKPPENLVYNPLIPTVSVDKESSGTSNKPKSNNPFKSCTKKLKLPAGNINRVKKPIKKKKKEAKVPVKVSAEKAEKIAKACAEFEAMQAEEEFKDVPDENAKLYNVRETHNFDFFEYNYDKFRAQKNMFYSGGDNTKDMLEAIRKKRQAEKMKNKNKPPETSSNKEDQASSDNPACSQIKVLGVTSLHNVPTPSLDPPISTTSDNVDQHMPSTSKSCNLGKQPKKDNLRQISNKPNFKSKKATKSHLKNMDRYMSPDDYESDGRSPHRSHRARGSPHSQPMINNGMPRGYDFIDLCSDLVTSVIAQQVPNNTFFDLDNQEQRPQPVYIQIASRLENVSLIFRNYIHIINHFEDVEFNTVFENSCFYDGYAFILTDSKQGAAILRMIEFVDLPECPPLKGREYHGPLPKLSDIITVNVECANINENLGYNQSQLIMSMVRQRIFIPVTNFEFSRNTIEVFFGSLDGEAIKFIHFIDSWNSESIGCSRLKAYLTNSYVSLKMTCDFNIIDVPRAIATTYSRIDVLEWVFGNVGVINDRPFCKVKVPSDVSNFLLRTKCLNIQFPSGGHGEILFFS